MSEGLITSVGTLEWDIDKNFVSSDLSSIRPTKDEDKDFPHVRYTAQYCLSSQFGSNCKEDREKEMRLALDLIVSHVLTMMRKSNFEGPVFLCFTTRAEMWDLTIVVDAYIPTRK